MVFFTSSVFAQNIQNYAAICINIESLTDVVTEFGEDASLTMNSVRETRQGSVKIPTVMFINYKTKTWTLVERVEHDIYCVIATGENISPYIKK
jgi:hypothetical protein